MNKTKDIEIDRTDYQHTILFDSPEEVHNAILVYAGERQEALDKSTQATVLKMDT